METSSRVACHSQPKWRKTICLRLLATTSQPLAINERGGIMNEAQD